MTAARKPRLRMQTAEFIAMIAPYPDSERWELLDGQPIMMAPQTERHQIVVANLLDRLRPLFAGRECRVLPGLGLLSDEVDDYAPIPDVVVRCGPIGQGGYAKDPVLVAEVLSPSTMDWDRGGKLTFYRTITSLQVILIVYQREMRVEAWTREGSAWRHVVRQGSGASIDLSPFRGKLTLAEIYADVPVED